MSEGPIKREREAWLPARVTTNPKTSMHAVDESQPRFDRSYCGRKVGYQATTMVHSQVTCSECLAALRADGFDPNPAVVGETSDSREGS